MAKASPAPDAKPTIPQEFLDALQEWFDVSDFADHTMLAYRGATLQWMRTAHPWESGWEKRSMQWSDSLNGRALKTKALYVGAARLFVDFLLDERIVTSRRNPLSRVKLRKVSSSGIKRRALTDDEVRLLIDSCDLGTVLGVRDRCIIRVMIYTALRISAVAGIMIEDLFMSKDRWYVVYQAKGQQSKQRNKPLNPLVIDAIKEYLAKTNRKLTSQGPLFTKVGGAALATTGIRKMLNRRFKKCEISDRTVSVHSLRHTAATKAMEQGVDLKTLQLFMDHESLATTDVYVHERQGLDALEEFEISYDEETE